MAIDVFRVEYSPAIKVNRVPSLNAVTTKAAGDAATRRQSAPDNVVMIIFFQAVVNAIKKHGTFRRTPCNHKCTLSNDFISVRNSVKIRI